ncbi:proteolytic subunit of ATP-dependent Clp protease [Chloropicon roscoffensis]|uniref:ATP-dependent Clp protease proteolytic subunit n=1 Tax=Chloropicon roscoffensis TaxID=1461544 RepID=A0A7S3FPK6_9CHLO|mmetsp:Transcript_31/g.108  ORF Transcript_31/g.108 Transcript_31/m.108 type:complete len:269 (+) Transcript_31:75-881(+)
MECLGRTQARRVLGGSKTNGVNRGIGWEQQYHAKGRRNNNNKQLFQRHTQATATRTTTTTTRKLVTKMPVAVPRVPYRTPQEGNWQWVDLWNCLYRERILFVGQGVTEDLGNQLVGTLLYLDSVSQKDLQMYINTCEGGQLVPSLALYDTMRHLKSDIVTVGFGGVMGMAAFLMCSGTKGKRLSLAHTRIMMHLPSGTARGSSTDMWNETRELLRIRGYMLKCLETQTGKSQEQLLSDFSRNTYFTPETAQEYGIIDQVLRPRRKAGK